MSNVLSWLRPYLHPRAQPAPPVALSEDEKDFLSERAAIIEVDAGLPREQAERLAWQCLARLRTLGEAP